MTQTLLVAAADDGTEIRALEEGAGPVILLVPGGLEDGSSWAKVSASLATDHRVLVLLRRQYRLDITNGPVLMADEVADITALTRAVGEQMLIVGHSSGAVLTLEALTATPSAFYGSVVYEPPIALGGLLGGEALVHAQRAIASGKPGKAVQIFTRDMVKLPAWQAGFIRMFVTLSPKMRGLAPRQMDDVAAMDALGERMDTYAKIPVPVLLLGGDRSPGNLADVLTALGNILPRTSRSVLKGQGHSAHMRAPQELARIIAAFYQTTRADYSAP